MLNIDEAIEILKNGRYLTNREEKQIAEWLEELKMLRLDSCMIHMPERLQLVENGYNKAINDAKSVILQTLDNEILVDTLHLRLEQLKEQTNE